MQQYFGNVRSAPRWAGDWLDADHIDPIPYRLDPTAFQDAAGPQIVLTANAAQNATSLTVSAVPLGPSASTVVISQGNTLIPAGTVLDFSAGGSGKFAKLTADAHVGDTTLTVAPLPTALVIGDTADWSRFGTLAVLAGTFVSRTFAQRTAGTGFHPAVAGDDEFLLTCFDKPDLHRDADFEGYRHRSVVYENYLPGFATLSAGANEVQTVAVDTIMSGGAIGITAIDKNGVPQSVFVAYNTSWTQTVADIQTALIAVLGTAAVAAAVTAVKNMTLTFSGAGYAGVSQTPVGVDISAATGPTKVSVTRSTPGGTPLLTKLRSLYLCRLGQD